MNGGWFWWGGKEPADFIAVWRHMFDYLTHTKQLHNLVWAYSPNHGAKTAAYYPGDAYIDLVGLDAYTDHIDPTHIRGGPEVAALPKPFGFTEFGPHGASNPPGDFDFRRFLAGVETNFPTARHFLVWDSKWNPAENKFAREFYNDPRVITRATLPAGLTGK
jgi:mannan endo-1,4-beta-mannosidase